MEAENNTAKSVAVHQMDLATSILEKTRRSKGRADKYIMKDKFEIQPMKKSKPSSENGNAPQTHVEQKLHEIQEANMPNVEPEKLFDSLKLADYSFFMGEGVARQECDKCKKKSKIYCADCQQILHHHERVPKVNLPFKLTIVHHESEKVRKSSAVPAKMLVKDSQEFCEVISYPTKPIPEFDPATTLILYPHAKSKRVLDLDLETLQKVKNVVAIDCTWNQTNGILNNFTNPEYQFVRLEEYNTTFWRYQFHQPNCLATIEAIYYFFKEFDCNYSAKMFGEDYVYDGKYDNLLFFYTWNYYVIQEHYKNNTTNSFRKIKNYIKYEAKSESTANQSEEVASSEPAKVGEVHDIQTENQNDTKILEETQQNDTQQQQQEKNESE